jgi:hypothetical protein
VARKLARKGRREGRRKNRGWRREIDSPLEGKWIGKLIIHNSQQKSSKAKSSSSSENQANKHLQARITHFKTLSGYLISPRKVCVLGVIGGVVGGRYFARRRRDVVGSVELRGWREGEMDDGQRACGEEIEFSVRVYQVL